MANINRSSLASTKKLAIDIRLEEKTNEPNLTLGHLTKLANSITDSFSTGIIIVPDVYSLRIFDSQDQEINIKGSARKLEIDFKRDDRDPGLIRSEFYPDDVISILKSIKKFLEKEYGIKKRIKFEWSYELDSIQSQIRNAGTDKETIVKITMGDLKNAAQEIAGKITATHQKIVDGKAIELDDAQPIIDDIKSRFKNATSANEYEKIWEELCAETASALGESSSNEKIIITLQKKFSHGDAKKIINAFYKEVIDQYKNKQESEIEPPWNRLSPEIRKKLTEDILFSVNQINVEAIINQDITKTREVIELTKRLFEELKKEPAKTAAAAEADGDEDGGGGDQDEEPTAKQAEFSTPEEIIRLALDELFMRSSDEFLEYFATEPVDLSKLEQSQRDWLILELPAQLRNLANEGQLKTQISAWITANLSPEMKAAAENAGTDDTNGTEKKAEATDRYKVNSEKFKELHQVLTAQFFKDHEVLLAKWILESIEKARSDEPVVTDTPPAETVVPEAGAADLGATDRTADGADTTGDTAENQRGLNVAKERAARDLTTEFIFNNFGEMGDQPELRNAIQLEILKSLPANPSADDIKNFLQNKQSTFSQLLLNEKVFTAAQNYDQKAVSQLVGGNPVDIANIENTIDTILVLSKDPREYFAKFKNDDKGLLKQFGLENKNINADQLRKLILGLVIVRRYKAGGKITPWFINKEDEDEKISQSFDSVRTFIKNHGEDGVAALNFDEENINNSQTISDRRREIIRQLYQDLWLSTVNGKSQEEIMEIYEEYGVDIIGIDYSAPPPGFGVSELAQAANSGQLAGGDAINARNRRVNGIISKGKQKMGKAALSAVAPELAPFLAALENMPVLGSVIKEIEEKTNKLIWASLAGTAGITILNIIKGGKSALIGGAIGGTLGGILGTILGWSPLGTAFGVGVGASIGSGLGYQISSKGGIGNWFKNLGKGGGSGAGTNTVLQSGLAGPAVKTIPAAQASFALGFGGTAVGTAIVTMTAAGTQLHPVANTIDSTGEQSQYISLVKTADVASVIDTPPDEVTYTVTISADKGYSITINEANDVSTISFSDESKETEKKEKNLDDLVGITIENGDSFDFKYTQEYGADYMDSRITNRFSINFSYRGSKNGDDKASTSYSIGIGDYPSGEGCWPALGELTQGPFGIPNKYGNTHHTIQAIDIHNARGTEIFSPFEGEACAYPLETGWLCADSSFGTQHCYGNHVVLDTGEFILGFAHMDQFSSVLKPGSCTHITADTLIGTMGNSGLYVYTGDVGVHLHYELRPSSLDFNNYVPGPIEIHQITDRCPI